MINNSDSTTVSGQSPVSQNLEHRKSGKTAPSGSAASSDGAPARSTHSAAPRLGPRAGRRVFDELPGASEGKAALIEFEMEKFDFVETAADLNQLGLPPVEMAAQSDLAEVQLEFVVEDEVREEQVCFNFGDELDLQLPDGTAEMMVGALGTFERTELDERFRGVEATYSVEIIEKQLILGDEIGDDKLATKKNAEKNAGKDADKTTEGTIKKNSESHMSHSSTDSFFKGAVGSSVLQADQGLEISADESETPSSVDDLTAALPALQVGTDEELMQSIEAIPEKMAFKIGEVADMVGVKQYVLRYWESEFDALRPRKSRNGQRIYTRREVETALMIKKLLYTDRFSIEGARSALKQMKSRVREEKDWKVLIGSHERVRSGLKSLVGEIRKLRQELL